MNHIPGHNTGNQSWYAVQTFAGEEAAVCSTIDRKLKSRGSKYELLLPRRRLRLRKRKQFEMKDYALFPGYLFANLRREDLALVSQTRTHGLIGPIRMGGQIRPIPDREIELIQELVDDSGLIELSNAVTDNRHVEILEGPLRGHEGAIVKIDRRKSRARIELMLLGQTRQVDIGIDVIGLKTVH